MSDVDMTRHAEDLHRRLIVLDGHLDIPPEFGDPGREGHLDGPGQFDLVKAARGAVSGVNLCLGTSLNRSTPAGFAAGRAAHDRKYATIQTLVQDHPDKAALATSPAQFREIVASDRLAIMLSLQNAAPFDGDVQAIRRWAQRGVQMIALAFIGNNAFADSSRPYPFAGPFKNGGLSALGRDAVSLMNELGVVVDVSQLSDQALADTLTVARAPVVASHSSPRGFHQTRRNLSDDDLQAIAAAGGLVNVVGFAYYLADSSPRMEKELRDMWVRYELTDCEHIDDAIFHPLTAEWTDERFGAFMHEFHDILDLGNPSVSVDRYADAVAYVVDRIGIDHVGLSSDFNHGGGLIGWRDIGETHNVTAALLRRGFSDQEIAKLWGDNFLRTWADVQACASRKATA